MHQTDALSPETELLLRLSLPTLSAEQVDTCRELLAQHGRTLDFGVLIDQAARHGVLPLIGRNVMRHGIHIADDGSTLLPYHWLYHAAYETNLSRNRAIADEAGHLLRGLRQAGVKFAVRKGPALAEHRYRDLGARRMVDVDILVLREDLPSCAEVLGARGFGQGRIDRTRARVVPFERSTRAFWRINLNNELPYIKLAHRDDVEVYEVDLCLSIFPLKGPNYPATSELLDRAVEVPLCGADAWVLSPEDELLDLCVHLHKEATSLLYIGDGADLKLQRFQDVALTCAALANEDFVRSFVRRVTESGVASEVYYTLHHTHALYGQAVPEAVLDALRPDKLAYLDEYGHADGNPGTWRDPFIARMFDPSRRLQVTATSSIPVH